MVGTHRISIIKLQDLELDETHIEFDCGDCHENEDFSKKPSCEGCHDDKIFPESKPGKLVKINLVIRCYEIKSGIYKNKS